jgi:hypothetical protein
LRADEWVAVSTEYLQILRGGHIHGMNQRRLWNRTATPVSGTEAPRWPPTSGGIADSRANTGMPRVHRLPDVDGQWPAPSSLRNSAFSPAARRRLPPRSTLAGDAYF